MKPTILRVFDFDQTLIRTPADTPENKKLYEKTMGLPWTISKGDAGHWSKKLGRPVHPRKGWWGRHETLKPPLVPDPVPDSFWIKETVESLWKSVKNESSVNLIMSGRHTGLNQEVLRILHQGGFPVQIIPAKTGNRYEWIGDNLQLYLLGMDGPFPDISPKPQETFPWKVWIINQYRLVYPEIERIELWEDRDDHVVKFMELNHEFSEDVVVYHVRA